MSLATNSNKQDIYDFSLPILIKLSLLLKMSKYLQDILKDLHIGKRLRKKKKKA